MPGCFVNIEASTYRVIQDCDLTFDDVYYPLYFGFALFGSFIFGSIVFYA